MCLDQCLLATSGQHSPALMCISAAGNWGSKVKWLLSWPLLLLLYLTIPNCAKPRWEKFFMLSFILSTVWIAVFSYFMVWMVSAEFTWSAKTLSHLPGQL